MSGELEQRITQLREYGIKSVEAVEIVHLFEKWIEEMWSECPDFDMTKPINLEEYSGLNAMETIYLRYKEEVEEWKEKWSGKK